MHIPVLLHETIELLNIKSGDLVVDATLGSGGHTKELAKFVGNEGKVVAIDIDPEAISAFEKRAQREFPELASRILMVNDNFANLPIILDDLKIEHPDAIFADLGWRIEQVEDPRYGMSFNKDARLDMRLGKKGNEVSAFEIINNWDESTLTKIFQNFGQERGSRRVAGEIIKRRKSGQIQTTKELADLVARVLGQKKSRMHPATKIFQALRMVVNDEQENIKKLLEFSLQRIEREGRIGIISFHSLEDSMVKHFFAASAKGCICPREMPVCGCGKTSALKIITKKPVVASAEEIRENPRARSARLRVAEKI